ncbi:MAG: hypothetical protein E6G56_04185 [Actinobacteria bacterium]|nr:MAG: hypothetical protein E6G56_04185 [Actinomycetota bacterium]
MREPRRTQDNAVTETARLNGNASRKSSTRYDEPYNPAKHARRTAVTLAATAAVTLGAMAGTSPADAGGKPSAAKCNRAILRAYHRHHPSGFSREQLNDLYRRLHKRGVCPNVHIP